ncbi:DUF1330 domain-containing protein [Pseudooceanicola nitratireducens]|uniref:DUF1330 domain-containing protein n=1 Tax=Pseudooceanicola nitratireducens TaxID=517719 RepID=UPI0023F1387B|nr:DUF1330 domain-containing protein [Pseudooceanicola nitratireducens]
MGVFVVASVRIRDRARYDAYQARFAGVFAGCGGAVLAADEAPLRLEGDDSPDKIVLMQFDSLDQASGFLLSEEYQTISRDREAGAVTTTHLIRALDPPIR